MEERQTTEQVAHTQWPSITQKIAFHQVILAFERIDGHLFLPAFELPSIVHPHIAAAWTASWWDYTSRIYELQVYCDGSYASCPVDGDATSSMATAAFVLTDSGWAFAGALSSSLCQSSSSYTAELAGAVVAHKFVYDLLKLHEIHYADRPKITFFLDALTVSNQASGQWSRVQYPTCGRCMRDLALLIESRFQVQLRYQHIKGHSGHPGNELVDTLAGRARQDGGLTPVEDWISELFQPTFVQQMDWMWMLFAPEFVHQWDGHDLQFTGPATIPDPALVPVQSTTPKEDEPPSMARVVLRMTTCNVLSLKGTKETGTTMTGIARQVALLRQLANAKIGIFALQETRMRKLHRSVDDNFILLKAAATDTGQGGILMGFSRTQPYCYEPARPGKPATKHLFKEAYLKVIAFDSRFLIVKLAAPCLRCLVIAGHAPHTGQALTEIAAWWEKLYQHIPQHLRDWPIVLLCDANATVGAHPSQHIGDHAAAKYDPKSEPFESFIAECDLWLPSTFSYCQVGHGDTWTHTSGSARRIDYVGLPRCWHPRQCTSWISSSIDPTIVRADHSAACVEIAFDMMVSSPGRVAQADSTQPLRIDPKTIEWHGLTAAALPHLDVHTHYQFLYDHLAIHLRAQQVPSKPNPRKTTLSSATWTLVCEKREWRKQLHAHQSLQRKTLIEAFFVAWRHARADLAIQFEGLLALQDRLIATSLLQFRRLGLLVTRAMRADDKAFFQGLLHDGAEFLSPKDVKKLWAVVRRSMPKFQNRKVGYSPTQLEWMEEQSSQHFAQLELGVDRTPAELLQKCHVDQTCAACRDLGTHIELESLPTLPEVEDSLRATRADRATGFDIVPSSVFHHHAAFLGRYFYQVILKIFCWGTEPLQGKGGFLKMIPKRIGAIEAKHFRGILLLPTLAKRVHAIARSRLMRQAGSLRDPAQLGGYAHQQVAFGSQTLRALANIFSARHYSSAVLYVDLAGAFHHLVRQLVTGVGAPTDLEFVMQRLRAAATPMEAQDAGHGLIGVLEQMQIDPLLLRLLRDVHEGTWFSLRGTDLKQTFRGTRPGSPLADAIFHLLMTDVAKDLRAWLHQCVALRDIYRELDLEPIFVIWSDDFAIPLAVREAQELVPAVTSLMKFLHERFAARGFTINYDAGKTSAVLTFVGPQAPEHRRSYLLTDCPGVEIQLSEDQHVWLHFAMKYKHLGALFSSSHSFEPELSQRIGLAMAAFQKMARPVLRNRHFPLVLRLRFFHSLIGSKLFFGMGAWATPTLQQMKRLRLTYHKMLRSILGGETDEYISNAQLLRDTQALDVRVRIAVDRLLYAQRVFQVGPDYLQQLLHIERAHCGEGAWLRGLQADYEWLRNLSPADLPVCSSGDFTELIEIWQSQSMPWKRILKQAVRRHHLQEEIMVDAHHFHHNILKELKKAGATFSPDIDSVLGAARDECHRCDCGRVFTSSQGLALHQKKRHGRQAPEAPFITGATCPACMTYFWSSNRLAMHLAYMPRSGGVNQCFAALQRRGGKYEVETVAIPAERAHAVRLDSLRSEGPLPQPIDRREHLLEPLNQQIAGLECLVEIRSTPVDPLSAGESLGDALTQFTVKWAECRKRNLADAPVDLIDGWIQILDVYGRDHDEWAAWIFQQWGQHLLPDIQADLLDGEIERMLEDKFVEALEIFPRTEHLRQLGQCRLRQQRILADLRQPLHPHRPVRRGTANAGERDLTRQQVPSLYFEQCVWQEAFRQIRWMDMPAAPGIPRLPGEYTQPTLLVVHLFSGRRRTGDLHWHLQRLAPALGVRFIILSMDTANSSWWGDLWHTSPPWQMLCKCYAAGLVAFTMVGSPCETFSEARFTPPPPETQQRWPRPLRSRKWFFGLPDLTMKELRQVHAGTNFFLQRLTALGAHIAHGGLFLSEHPGIPADPERPTTWRASLTELLRAHADVHLHHVNQWMWGAASVKPTGLLCLRMPRLLRSLYAHCVPGLRRPQQVAIGKDEAGAFRTSRLKEYPDALSAAFASAFCDQLRIELNTGIGPNRRWTDVPDGEAIAAWIQEAAVACGQINRTAHFCPDYQPR